MRTVAVRVKVQPRRIPCPLCNCFSVPADTPKLKIEASSTEVEKGNSVTMTCQVISSNPELETGAAVSWFKDGRLLQEHEQEQNQKHMSKLTLRSVTKDMTGKYQCRASNDIGEGESEEVGLTVLCEFP